MKRTTTKAAATLCAALTAVCGMQAITASATTDAHPVSGNTQDSTEFGMNFSHNLYFWSVYNYPQGTQWSQTVRQGKVFGPGYSTTNLSGIAEGTALPASLAWARFLANGNYGSENLYYTEQPASIVDDTTQAKNGDQIVMTSNSGQKHAIFVTSVYSDYSLSASELVNGRVQWGSGYVKFGYNKLRRTSDGTVFTVNYVVRPVKEGDANGDSVVDSSDVTWLSNHYNAYSFPGADYNVQMAAADIDGDWQITWRDAFGVLMNNSDGRMTGNYSYSTTV